MKSDWQAEVGSQENSDMYTFLLHTTVGRYLNTVRAGRMALQMSKSMCASSPLTKSIPGNTH